jgi:predicted nucleotidyltransferase
MSSPVTPAVTRAAPVTTDCSQLVLPAPVGTGPAARPKPPCYTGRMHASRQARPRRPQRTTQRLIKTMARRLAEQFGPDQIILFGSYARGTAGPDSDVDLLVIMPVTRRQKAATEVAMRVAVHDIAVPKDIIVVTPEEVAQKRDITGTLIYPALREGKVLYTRG